MRDAETAASFAISQAKRRGLAEVGSDELLLGCLQTISLYGITQLGPWTFDLEALGVDWLERPARGTRVDYSQAVVDLFDLAARISAASAAGGAIQVDHLLAAFAGESGGLMGELKRTHGITGAAWRAAVAQLWATVPSAAAAMPPEGGASDYLTPEEAAAALNIHVQTLRAYVRSGKLPALRLAGERAIRIRRQDLETVLEPLVPQG